METEQIEKILNEAPKGSCAISVDGYVSTSAIAHVLSDLREILELRREVDALASQLEGNANKIRNDSAQ